MSKPKIKNVNPQAVAFATRLRSAIESRGMTQTGVADALGIRPPQINKICKGLNYPRPETISKIAEVLRMPVALLTGEGLPLIGELGAGRPRHEPANPDDLLKVQDLFPAESVAYRVVGKSMEDSHILDGDFVIVRPCQDADGGGIVVAWIAGTGALLKRYDREKHTIYSGNGRNRWTHVLQSDDVIVGVFVGLIRKA